MQHAVKRAAHPEENWGKTQGLETNLCLLTPQMSENDCLSSCHSLGKFQNDPKLFFGMVDLSWVLRVVALDRRHMLRAKLFSMHVVREGIRS